MPTMHTAVVFGGGSKNCCPRNLQVPRFINAPLRTDLHSGNESDVHKKGMTAFPAECAGQTEITPTTLARRSATLHRPNLIDQLSLVLDAVIYFPEFPGTSSWVRQWSHIPFGMSAYSQHIFCARHACMHAFQEFLNSGAPFSCFFCD